jgi:hypothetical protein
MGEVHINGHGNMGFSTHSVPVNRDGEVLEEREMMFWELTDILPAVIFFFLIFNFFFLKAWPIKISLEDLSLLIAVV